MIQGEGVQCGLALCSAARAKRYFQQGYFVYVAYVMDTREKGTATVDNVPIVWEFPDLFPEDMPGVPPERQVEFHIDLVHGKTLIAKTPYQLAPPEMQELST